MAIFKCKMCGGALEINNNETVATCEYCGTQQTLPKTNDDVISNLFNRANNLRLKCEFDKAAQIYEKIVQQDDSEAEAHWGLVLCKYGIEYVEDPKTFTRIPTCHRTLFEAVTADADYQAAIDYSDTLQQAIYEKEARAIDKIQKDILAIVKNEKPFDVFICYKETDETGKRTIDSTIANDIYYQLTQEGFKVFYAAITLEDKLGQEYEPYIFAALNSAKVMLALGTKPEYFNAIWVKNEWSRFLNLMKTDRSKLLIPCYRDMDAYDLPEEFAHLQAQDMSKIGFINDVVRGIKKLIQVDEPKTTVVKETVVSSGNANTASLLERAFMSLEDYEFDRADDFCEQVLNINPKCAEAYLGKLMAELLVTTQENLKNLDEPFDNKNNYQKVMRFGDDKLKSTLAGYIDHINTRNENARLESIYSQASSIMARAKFENEYKEAGDYFAGLIGYKDSESLAKECIEKAEIARKDAILSDAKYKISTNTIISLEAAIRLLESIPGWRDADERIETCKFRIKMIKEKAESDHKDGILSNAKFKIEQDHISMYEAAIKLLEEIPGWKDADEQLTFCNQRIEEIKAKVEADRIERERRAEVARKEEKIKQKRNKTISAIVIPIVCAVIAFFLVQNVVIIPDAKYNEAVALMDEGKYTEAIDTFEVVIGHKDSEDKIDECNYNIAIALMNEGKYVEAISAFEALYGYKDSEDKINECIDIFPNAKYNYSIKSVVNSDCAWIGKGGTFNPYDRYYFDCENMLFTWDFESSKLNKTKQFNMEFIDYGTIRIEGLRINSEYPATLTVVDENTLRLTFLDDTYNNGNYFLIKSE